MSSEHMGWYMILAGLGVLILRTWYGGTKRQTEAIQGTQGIRAHVHDPVARVHLFFRHTLLLWALFYFHIGVCDLISIWSISLVNDTFILKIVFSTFFTNLFQNLATIGLLLIYAELYTTSDELRRRSSQSRVYRTGWVFVVLAITAYEFLETTRSSALVSTGTGYAMIYGLGQSVALFLVIGRLEESFIQDHMRRIYGGPEGTGRMIFMKYYWLITLGYLYAALQPAYILFGDQGPLLAVLVLVALVLKLALVSLFRMVEYREPHRLSSLECYFFEQERFAEEGLNNYERNFLRRYLNPSFARQHKKKHLGYLGVEYEALTAFKLNSLFGKQGIDGLQGGMFVRELQYGSDAMRQGIRRGDVITHVDGAPYGGGNTLSILLKGKDVGAKVRVKFLRPVRQAPPCVVKLSEIQRAGYTKHQVTVTLGDISDFQTEHLSNELRSVLGLNYIGHDPEHGVWCKGTVEGQDMEWNIVAIYSPLWNIMTYIADHSSLVWMMSRITPGEKVHVYCYPRGSDQQNQGLDVALQQIELETKARFQLMAVGNGDLTVRNKLKQVDLNEMPQANERDTLLKGYPNLFSQRLLKPSSDPIEGEENAFKLDVLFKRRSYASVEQLDREIEAGENFIALFDLNYNIVYQALVMKETIKNYLRPVHAESLGATERAGHSNLERITAASSLLLQEIPMSTLYLFICPRGAIQGETNALGTREHLCTKGIFTKLTLQVTWANSGRTNPVADSLG